MAEESGALAMFGAVVSVELEEEEEEDDPCPDEPFFATESITTSDEVVVTLSFTS